MMKRVTKPAPESGPSFRTQNSQYASRPFASNAEEHEAQSGESRIRFSLDDIDIFPRETVQPKLRKGTVGDRYEQKQNSPLPNRTGMPDRLKAGIESLSGIDMSDVRVHANSDKPAQLNALAFTQGNQIHLGPGQTKHLPHEAWHVVQQKQGRVRATTLIKGLGINDDSSLERESDMMGAKTAQFTPGMDCDFVKPPQLNVLAYGQRNGIHVRSVLEKHLPYDAGHVMLKRALLAPIGRRWRETSNSGPVVQMMKSSATVEAEIISDGNQKNSIENTAEGYSGSELQPKAILNALPQTQFIVEGNAKQYNGEGELVSGSKPGQCAEPHAVANAIKGVYERSVQESFNPEESRIKINKITVHCAFHENKHQETFDSSPKYYGKDREKYWNQGIARRCPTCASWIDGNLLGGFEDAEVIGLHDGADLLIKIKRGVQDAGYLQLSEQQREDEKSAKNSASTNIKNLVEKWNRDGDDPGVMAKKAFKWIANNVNKFRMTVPQAVEAFTKAGLNLAAELILIGIFAENIKGALPKDLTANLPPQMGDK